MLGFSGLYQLGALPGSKCLLFRWRLLVFGVSQKEAGSNPSLEKESCPYVDSLRCRVDLVRVLRRVE